MHRCLLAALALLALAPAAAGPALAQTAAVERLEIRDRADAFGGAAFGSAGAYEQITAVAHLQIDPTAAANRGIVDLDKAPRGPDGLVRYSTDVVILRPKDPAKGSRVLVYDVVNRGSRLLLGVNGASAQNPVGDGFLMRQGYTMVWGGWQGDLDGPVTASPVPPGPVRARLPVATEGGRPITGRVEVEAVFDAPPPAGGITLPYPAADFSPAAVSVTVRQRAGDAPRPLPAGAWRFSSNRTIQVDRPADMDAGAIYQVVYTARDPIVGGLGFAATRDLIAFLRHDRSAANPFADRAFDMAIAVGASQSGRYLRDFLWQGFNRDQAGRIVFDGMIPMIAGARKTWTNMRWSQPGRFSRQHEDHLVPGNQFPFTYATLADPVTGMEDGILRRCGADGTCPKVLHLDTSAEFWQAGASRIGTGGTGGDVPLPATVRAYLLAGGTHVPGLILPYCTGAVNPVGTALLQRSLMVALVDWVAGRQEPPASRWPNLADGTLARPSATGFPDLSGLGVRVPPANDGGGRVAYDRVPPRSVKPDAWPVFVPATDADGNDRAGVRLPVVAAPAGTYLGWSPRKPGFAEGEQCNLFGSLIPFASDQTARAGRDPRPSLAERYPGPDGRRAQAQAAADALRADRLLLAEDVERAVAEAVK